MQAIAGTFRARAYLPFEQCASAIARTLSSEPEDGAGILLRHTQIGYLTRFSSAELEKQIIKELLAGNSSIAAEHLQGPKGVRLAREELYWCKSCTAGDLADLGVPHWRVVHQIPLVTRCPWHFERLIKHCEKCQTAIDNGARWLLPGDGCKCIGKRKEQGALPSDETSVRDPYRRLLINVDDVFQGRRSELRPSAWRALVRSYISVHGSTSVAALVAKAQVKAMWQASREAPLAASILKLIAEGALEQELGLYTRPREPLLMRLVLLDVMDQTHKFGSVIAENTLTDEVRLLEEYCDLHGLAAGTAGLLMKGWALEDVGRATGTTSWAISKALSSLPGDLQQAVSVMRPKTGRKPRRPREVEDELPSNKLKNRF